MNVFQLDDGDTGEALPVPIPVTPGTVSIQFIPNGPRDLAIASLKAEIAELTDELELLKREYRVEAIHSDPEAPCDVCDHLMIEDALDRAEAAEAERDRLRLALKGATIALTRMAAHLRVKGTD